MRDADMREFLALTLSLPDGDARRLFRRQYVREASISVVRDLEEWVAAEEDVHAAGVLGEALKALMSGDELGRALAAKSIAHDCLSHGADPDWEIERTSLGWIAKTSVFTGSRTWRRPVETVSVRDELPDSPNVY